MIWRSEIHIGVKVDAGVRFFSGVIFRESEVIMLGSAHASTTYGM
jgi:hypothetical protein